MKRLVIMEGPDGSGKSTLGSKLVEEMRVPVVNHGPYKGEHQIWRHYFDSMLPAYSDESDVILDRSWIAEPIYGLVFRGGLNRVEHWQQRILEHVAGHCLTTVIWCLPPVEACLKAFNSRRSEEMLESERQLREVWGLYLMESRRPQHKFHSVLWDYTRQEEFNLRSLL